MPRSVAVGDFNDDGKPDLAVTNQNDGSVSLLLGNGDGTFRPHMDAAVGTAPLSLVVGDFNKDGKPDLAVTNWSDNSVSVLLGNGDGTFRSHMDYATGGLSRSVTIGDFNGDGKPDLAVANWAVPNGGQGSVSVLLGNGDGTFQNHVDFLGVGDQQMSVVAADLNGDGTQDVAVGGIVLLGNGDGTFQSPLYFDIGRGPQSMAVGDFNGDGKPDLATANYYSTNDVAVNENSVYVLLGNGDGTFRSYGEYKAGDHPLSVTVADVNGDGKPDLAVANADSNSVSVLLGNGDGTFQTHVDYPTEDSPDSVAVGDFDGDGKPDLAVTNWSDNSVSVLLGNGEGTVLGVERITFSWGLGLIRPWLSSSK